MIKKLLPVVVIVFLLLPCIPVKADTPSLLSYYVYIRRDIDTTTCYYWSLYTSNNPITIWYGGDRFYVRGTDIVEYYHDPINGGFTLPAQDDSWSIINTYYGWNNLSLGWKPGCFIGNPIYDGLSVDVPEYDNVIDYNEDYPPPSPPTPDPPEPGSDWLDELWDWFLWQLGLNDDYTGDLDYIITGGDRDRIELTTPTPTPSPTPFPSPTPYSLEFNFPDGTTGTITGIPGDTYIINGGDTNYNTTNNYNTFDYDIFDVDLNIGDGDHPPEEGINQVIDSSYTYMDQNLDMSPVEKSFSVIPAVWLLWIGIFSVFPIIAGIIVKMLKG